MEYHLLTVYSLGANLPQEKCEVAQLLLLLTYISLVCVFHAKFKCLWVLIHNAGPLIRHTLSRPNGLEHIVSDCLKKVHTYTKYLKIKMNL